jgi:hypothetical protein
MTSRDLSLSYTERMAKAQEAQAKEMKRIRLVLTEGVFWVRRMSMAAILWATGIGLHLSSDQVAEILVTLLRRGK